jgi:hypothetical protein
MEVSNGNGHDHMFQVFKKITVFYINQVGESYHVYENGQFYMNGDLLHLIFIGPKKKSIVNLRIAYRVEIEQ